LIQETIKVDGHGEPCNPVTQLAAVGTSIDIPLGHKDAVWSFDHFDSMTIMVADAPHPDEIVLCMAVADGGLSTSPRW
jgi:hypothetical protein